MWVRRVLVIGLLLTALSTAAWGQDVIGRLYADEMYKVDDYITPGIYICATGEEWVFTADKLTINHNGTNRYGDGYDFTIRLSDYDTETRLLEVHWPSDDYINWFYFYYKDSKLWLVPYAQSPLIDYDELIFGAAFWLRRVQ